MTFPFHEVLSDPSGAALVLDLASAPEAVALPVALALPGAAACATARRLRAFVVPWRHANGEVSHLMPLRCEVSWLVRC